MNSNDPNPHPSTGNLSLNRRGLIRLGLAGAGGMALGGASGLIRATPAMAGTTYNMFPTATSADNESNYSDGPEMVTYEASNIRGGLWVHDPTYGTVENGSYSRTFHNGDYGYNVRRVRARSRRSFGQPMSVLVEGRTLWYDPLAGQVVDGLKRSVNGGLKVLIGHYSNDYNYAILLIRKSGYVTIQREYGHEYTTLANTSYPTPIETYRAFKVYWANDTISVYHRVQPDGSDDRLIVSTSVGEAPGTVDGVRYNNQPIGQYLDGAGVRMTYLRVWQG